MLKVVKETAVSGILNVIISTLIKPDSKPARVFNSVSERRAKLYYSDGIEREYNLVLPRAKFNFKKEKIDEIMDSVKQLGEKLKITPSTFPVKDEKDRVFYDTAKKAGAYLVTGNMKHYPDEPFILTPAEFTALIDAGVVAGENL